MDDDRDPFVKAGSVGDAMTARLAAALLESMGIATHLRGEAFGPYPVTVGRMAQTEIWVRRSDLADAEAALEETRQRAEHRDPSGASEPAWPVPSALAAAVAIILGLAVVITAMRLF